MPIRKLQVFFDFQYNVIVKEVEDMSNSLAAMRLELVREWSEKNLPLTPDKITYGSNKIVWWKAACGHEWQTSVKARSSGEKCPKSCRGNQ